MVGADGEGHQLVERHAVLGVDVEEAWRDGGEAQPLPNHADRHEEGRSDLLLRAAAFAKCLEGAELVERVQRGALHVLGQAVLLGDALGADDAGDRRGAGEALLLHQQLERAKAPAARGDLEHAGLAAVIVQHGADGEALQQGAPGDVLGQILDGDAGLDAADIRLAEDEAVEGDVARGGERDLGGGLRHGGSP